MPDEVTMTSGDVDFDKLFDDLAAGKLPEPAPTVVPVVESAPVAVTPTPEPVAEPIVAAPEPAAEPTKEPVAEPVVASAPEPTTREVLEKLIGQLKQPTPAPAAPQLQQAPQLYNDAELATLAQFQKDWPEHAAMVQLMLRGALTVNNQRISEEFSQYAASRDQLQQTMADKQQLSELRQMIPDYEKVRDPVIKWVHEEPSLPDYLRKAYVGVIEAGSSNEIADLVGRWKEATGVKTPKSTTTKPENELSEAAKQAAQTLAPVISQRTAPVKGEPQGFEDAFETFAKAM